MFQLQPPPKFSQKLKSPESQGEKNQFKNFAEFASTLRIVSGGQEVKFNLWDFQYTLSDLLLHHTCHLSKSRQTSLSTLLLAIYLYRAITESGFVGLIIAKTGDDTKELASKLSRMRKYLLIRTLTDSVFNLEFENGGRLIFQTSGKEEVGRGISSLSACWCDESAFYDLQRIIESVSPAMSLTPNPIFHYVSTPNGNAPDNAHFQILSTNNPESYEPLDICKSIREGTSEPFQYFFDEVGICKIFLHWYAHPIYSQDKEGFRKKLKARNMSPSAIAREYELDYLTEGADMMFSPISVDRAKRENLLMESGNPSESYLYSLDPAFGGNDFCCLHIFRIVQSLGKPCTFEIVHTYRMRNQSIEYNIEKIHKAIEKFPDGALITECNNGGITYHEAISRMLPFVRCEKFTTGNNKKSILTRLKYMIEAERIVYDSTSPIAKELLSFSAETLQATAGNDDAVMSAAIATHLMQSLGYIDIWVSEE